jgi:hypothetical protein
MATAKLTLPNGTTVDIDGTAEEVALLLAKFSGNGPPLATGKTKRKRKRTSAGSSSKPKSARQNRAGPQTLLATLASEDYFKSKRTINDVQKKLEEAGHIYAQSSLSTPLLRLTRSRKLRRIKEKDGWVYVN